MSTIQNRFGERIKSIRNRKNLKQQTLADRMGVDRTYRSKIENGEKNSTLETIHRLSIHLEVPLKEIFEFTKNEASTPSSPQS